MPKVFNLQGDDWDGAEDRPGWRSQGVRVGQRIGAELIGGGLYELEPGERLFPYHTHHANEEWLLVVRGRPTLRTADGEHELTEGDVVAFPRGDAGLHQVLNRTDAPIRVLMLSTKLMPEIVQYPDSGKLGLRDATGERMIIARPGDNLDYWDGED
ncbi:MAG TPA: cupin domain-containing protein [Solirubrobacteraceae bacterium]|nr:cupin domain-containing protein [Solirubrobacteraceae bacterium]